MRGLAPSSSSARTIRPLVALLKWLTTWRLPSISCSTRTVATRRRQVGRRPPERGVRRGAEVDQQPARRAPPRPPGRGPRATAPATGPRPGRVASPESRYAGIRSPGRTSPKSDEVTASRGCARRRGGGGERGGVEGVVEDAGVDASARAVGAVRGRRCGRPGRAGWDPRPSVAARGAGSVAGTGRPARRAPARGRRSSPGSDSDAEVERLAPAGRGLALARGQQDQHGRKRRASGPGWPGIRSRVVGHAEQPRGPGRVVHAGRAVSRAQRAAATAIASDPGRSSRCTPEFPPEVEAAARGRGAAPRLPDLDRTDLPLVTIDPRVVDGPRPGDAHRARRRRLRRPLRDRRRRGVRQPRRPGRRGGEPARRDAVRRRLQDPAAPDGALARAPPRCCPTRSARRCCGRSRSTTTGEGTDVDGRAGAGALARQARLRRRAAADRRRHAPTRRCTLLKEVGELRLAPRGGPRRGVAAAARAGGRRSRATTGASSSARCCRSSSGTPRSRCSPASPPPR